MSHSNNIDSQRRPQEQDHRKARWPRRSKLAAAVVGALLAGGGAYAATNWTVGIAGGSSGEAKSATVSNLTVAAVATPAAGNLLYPGGNGDVVLTISNPNPFPVTVTGVNLPTSSVFAAGFTTSGLSSAQLGCSSATSDVIWNYSSATSGSAHALTTPVTVAAFGQPGNPLTVTLTNDASMTAASPAACENTYFSMPSLAGIAASGGAAVATASPATDAWTN
jgi:hypothetical protein